MSLTSFGETQPSLAWSFESSNVDYVTNLSPSTTVGTPTYVAGKYGQAIKLTNPTNSDSMYISYPISTITIEQAGFSAACWVNFQALPPNSYQGLFLNFYGTNSTGLANNLATIYALLDYNSSKIILVYYVANNTFIIPTDYVVSLNTWYHFAFTIYGGYVRMYINGTQTTNPGTYNATTYANLTINTIFNLGNSVLGGYPLSYTIDDLRIYRTALTAAQVQSIYRAQGMPSRGVVSNDTYITSGLIAYYDTQNLSYPNSVNGTTWYDISGNGRSVTIRPGSSYNSAGKYITFNGTTNSGTTVAESGQSLTRWTVMCAFMQTANGNSFARVAGSSPTIDAGEIALFGQNLRINPPESSSWTSTSFSTTYNVWYHMCVAFDTTTTGVVDVWVYINGALVNSYTIDGTVESLTGYTIGARMDFNNEAMIGRMSLFAIYNRVLSQSEVSANYEFYKKTQVPAYLPIQLTGAPLFNQLSSSAASSAVGAFSLRAVNGVSAKAVQVRAVPSGASSPSVFSIIGNQFSAPDQSPTPPDTSVSGQTSYNGTTSNTIQTISMTPTTTGTTIHFNFKVNSRGNTPFKMQPPYPGSIFEIDTNTSNIAIVEYNISAASWAPLGNIAYTTSTNVYIAITISGATVKTYVNNSLAFTGTSRAAFPNASYYTTIGSWNGGGNANMTVYDFRVMNKSFVDGDFTPQDFHADERGNLLTAPVVGTSLQNWLGGATGYVTKWYDQSGKGNDASQNTAAAQPIIQRATKGPGYSTLWAGSQRLALGSNAYINNTPYSIQIVERRNVDSVTSGAGYFGWGGNEVNRTSNVLHNGYRAYSVGYPDSQYQVWSNQYGDDKVLTNISIKFATAATENVAYTWHIHDLSHASRIYSWRGGTLYSAGVSNFLNFLRPEQINQYFLGWSSVGYYKGEIYELLVFTQSLHDLDGTTSINKIYQNQLSYTGT